MLEVAFPSFKNSKLSGEEFPQNTLQVSVSGACLLAPPPPQYKIRSAVPVQYLTYVLRLSCVVHGPICGRFMGYQVNGFPSKPLL